MGNFFSMENFTSISQNLSKTLFFRKDNNSEYVFSLNYFYLPLLKKIKILLSRDTGIPWKLKRIKHTKCGFHTSFLDFTQIFVNLTVTRDLCNKIDIKSHRNFLRANKIVLSTLFTVSCI
jgi:hypothetical protein